MIFTHNIPLPFSFPLPKRQSAQGPLLDKVPSQVFMAGCLQCFYYATPDAEQLLVYCSGEEEDLDLLEQLTEHYMQSRMSVLLLMPTPGENGQLQLDELEQSTAQVLPPLTELVAEIGAVGTVFVHGRSVGQFPALILAKAQQPAVRGLILESCLPSLADYLHARGLAGEFSASEVAAGQLSPRIADVTIPTLMFLGARDSLVKVDQAEKIQLECGAKSKQFFVVPGANRENLQQVAGPMLIQSIKQFANKLCGITNWSYKKRRK